MSQPKSMTDKPIHEWRYKMIAETNTDTHVFFYGGMFSQWARSPFIGTLYVERQGRAVPYGNVGAMATSEQYMMAAKAATFGDGDILRQIMSTGDPSEQKALGRQVKNFDGDRWNSACRDIVFMGNWYKFTQNKQFLDYLLGTEDKTLVEASRYDRIWGVGLHWNDPAVKDEVNWQGTNWLGEAIMKVRRIYREHGLVDNPLRV